MKPKIWVGPITSVESARTLIAAGASGVVVPTNSTSDLRQSIQAFSSAVGANRVALMLTPLADRSISLGARLDPVIRELEAISPAFVELDVRFWAKADLSRFSSVGFDVRLSGFALDYDEDPEWLTHRLKESPVKCSHFVVTVIPGWLRPFTWLRETARDYDDVVVLEDFVQLCADYPVAISGDWSSVSSDWFVEQLAGKCQLMAYLGTRDDTGRHPVCVSEAELIDFLGRIRAA